MCGVGLLVHPWAGGVSVLGVGDFTHAANVWGTSPVEGGLVLIFLCAWAHGHSGGAVLGHLLRMAPREYLVGCCRVHHFGARGVGHWLEGDSFCAGAAVLDWRLGDSAVCVCRVTANFCSDDRWGSGWFGKCGAQAGSANATTFGPPAPGDEDAESDAEMGLDESVPADAIEPGQVDITDPNQEDAP